MKCIVFILFCTNVATAQLPGFIPPLAPSDSTLLINSASQQYDFYYSQKQAAQFVGLSNASYTQSDQIKRYRFRDKTYTQWVSKGLPQPVDFDDYVWIGAGILTEIKPNGEW